MGLQTLSRHHLSKLLADAIVLALAHLRSEGTSRLYELCPCGFVQRGQVLLCDALTDEGVDETGIEVVASTDGADGWYRRYVELEGVAGRADSDAAGSAGADEEGAVVGDVLEQVKLKQITLSACTYKECGSATILGHNLTHIEQGSATHTATYQQYFLFLTFRQSKAIA